MARRKGSSATLRGVQSRDLDTMSFGQALRAIRTKYPLSQTALAQALDRSTSFISLVETDQRRPSRDLVDRIIQALKLDKDSEEATALLRAAGFDPGEISGIITRLVTAIAAEVEMGESQRLRLTADLTAQTAAWKAHFEAQRDLVAGKFDAVKTRCDDALNLPYISPTLRVSTLLTRADAEVHQGALTDAELSAEAAANAIAKHSVIPAWESIAIADSLALRGMIALDLVRYAQSKQYLEQAIDAYQQFLSTGAGAEDDIAYIGIGLSYKRLVELMMLQRDSVKASAYSVAAESYLLRARPSEERDRWRRRNREQMAWIASEQHEFAKAINLRQRTREELTDAGDTYGLIRNQLYTGNDYLKYIKYTIRKALPEASVDGRPASDTITTRMNATIRALRDEEIQEALGNAEDDYRAALTGLRTYDHKMLLGLCLSNLATVLRYKALLDDSPPPDTNRRPSEEACALLTEALTIENGLKQPGRIAAIYEALADLEIDATFGRGAHARREQLGGLNDDLRRHLNDARVYIEQGLIHLSDYPPTASTSAAAVAQSKRLRNTADSLKAWLEEAAPGTEWEYSGASREAYAPTEDERAWQDLCVKLLALVRRLIAAQDVSDPVAMLATTNRDDRWNKRILDLEVEPGGRRIIQNGLSDGLAALVRAGFTADGAQMHSDRFDYFSKAVRMARTSSDQARDLCCRRQVEHDLSDTNTAWLTRMQIQQALEWMDNHPNGYALESSSLPVPLAVYVKGDTILLEIPQDVAVSILDQRLEETLHDESLCYEFTDADRANELRTLFDKFVKAAEDTRAKEPNSESTKNWLRRLTVRPERKDKDARPTSMWRALAQAVKDTALAI